MATRKDVESSEVEEESDELEFDDVPEAYEVPQSIFKTLRARAKRDAERAAAKKRAASEKATTIKKARLSSSTKTVSAKSSFYSGSSHFTPSRGSSSLSHCCQSTPTSRSTTAQKVSKSLSAGNSRSTPKSLTPNSRVTESLHLTPRSRLSESYRSQPTKKTNSCPVDKRISAQNNYARNNCPSTSISTGNTDDDGTLTDDIDDLDDDFNSTPNLNDSVTPASNTATPTSALPRNLFENISSTLDAVLNRLEQTETRMKSIEQKLSSSSGSTRGHVKHQVPLIVRVSFNRLQ